MLLFEGEGAWILVSPLPSPSASLGTAVLHPLPVIAVGGAVLLCVGSAQGCDMCSGMR